MAPEDKILQRFAMERQVSDVITRKDALDISFQSLFNKIIPAFRHM